MTRWVGLAAVLALLFGAWPFVTVAQEMSPEFDGCMTDTQGMQMAVRNCFVAELKRREAKLNAVITELRNSEYFDSEPADKKTRASLLKPSISVLDRAQEKWLPYRDAECEWNAELAGAGSLRGSMHALTYRSCQIKMTIDRIKLLKSL